MAKRRVGVEYSPSMLEPVRPGAVSPDRALCLPTFSHFLIVNKTSLSLSLSSSAPAHSKPFCNMAAAYTAASMQVFSSSASTSILTTQHTYRTCSRCAQ